MEAHVVIAADAGPAVGLGHVARCSALAAALREQEASVRCLALGATLAITIDGVDWIPAAGIDSVLAVKRMDMVVLDSYHAGPAERRKLADRAPLTVLHDAGGPPHEARLIVTVAGENGDGRLTGLAYACLRKPFWDLPIRRLRAGVTRVLVCTGGGDLDGAGIRWAAVARDALPAATTALLRGPYAPADGVPDGVIVIGPQPTLRDEMLAGDLVLTAAGQTALEALATGAPCIAIATVENQRRQARKIAESKAACVLEAPSDERLGAALRELDRDFDLRRGLASRAQEVVDGQGARRIARHLLALA